jgi:glutamine amidotransferase
MCRLLLVKSDGELSIAEHLRNFANVSKNSKEYQGHGWGMAYLINGDWKYYKNINPIWEDNINQFNEIKTKLLLAHARSAFKDEGVRIEYNMPFYDEENVFIFNGELQGVRINSDGRIGAEKVFNFIRRLNRGNVFDALKKGTRIITSRTRYVRAMNIIISNKDKVMVYSTFNQEPEYFTLHKKIDENKLIICSEPFSNEDSWEELPNNFMGVYK